MDPSTPVDGFVVTSCSGLSSESCSAPRKIPDSVAGPRTATRVLPLDATQPRAGPTHYRRTRHALHDPDSPARARSRNLARILGRGPGPVEGTPLPRRRGHRPLPRRRRPCCSRRRPGGLRPPPRADGLPPALRALPCTHPRGRRHRRRLAPGPERRARSAELHLHGVRLRAADLPPGSLPRSRLSLAHLRPAPHAASLALAFLQRRRRGHDRHPRHGRRPHPPRIRRADPPRVRLRAPERESRRRQRPRHARHRHRRRGDERIGRCRRRAPRVDPPRQGPRQQRRRDHDVGRAGSRLRGDARRKRRQHEPRHIERRLHPARGRGPGLRCRLHDRRGLGQRRGRRDARVSGPVRRGDRGRFGRLDGSRLVVLAVRQRARRRRAGRSHLQHGDGRRLQLMPSELHRAAELLRNVIRGSVRQRDLRARARRFPGHQAVGGRGLRARPHAEHRRVGRRAGREQGRLRPGQLRLAQGLQQRHAHSRLEQLRLLRMARRRRHRRGVDERQSRGRRERRRRLHARSRRRDEPVR